MLLNLEKLIEKYNIKISGVIHVGANTFEEKTIYDSLKLKQYWIEAIPELCLKFRETENFKIFNFAASNLKGNAKFFITNNIASSSLLKLKEHKIYHPEIFEEKEIVVKTDTIDSLKIKDANFINLDIQGSELSALKGAVKTLKYIKYIYTEVNTSEIYKNCCKLPEIDKFLSDLGFVRKEIYLTKYKWGDAFYIKEQI